MSKLNDTMIFWNSRKLAEEFELYSPTVGSLLKSLGAKRWRRSGSSGTIWYWDSEE